MAHTSLLGVTLHSDGSATFGLWAPFAEAVFVTGDFNNWSYDATPLTKDDTTGNWYTTIPNIQPGQEYKYAIHREGQLFLRNDPRALQLTAIGDKSVIIDPHFDWQDDNFVLPPLEQQVVYEMHVGTFHRPDPAMPGTFATATEKLDHLVELGVTTIELMPCNSVWEDIWWGYTASNIYSIVAAYGGRRAFQQFVKSAHQRGLGVILDVVYNHIDHEKSEDLWCFDGWCEDGKGGIYFYNDWRSQTPWGEVRPDYGRPEVRDFITDNALMWLTDCHVDGLRLDSVLAMRKAAHLMADGSGEDIPEAWGLLQTITNQAREYNPDALLIAEDLQGNDWITKPTSDGGAGFTTQWDPSFAACLREVLDPPLDESRDLEKIKFALTNRLNDHAFERLIYSESHDADANGHARLNEEIAPGAADSIFARKRSALAATLLFTTPGVPMLFQGQEFLEFGAFNHWRPLDWHKATAFSSTLQLYKDLIALRLNQFLQTAGLMGEYLEILHFDPNNKMIAYLRRDQGGPGDDVIVVHNLANVRREGYVIRFPAPGTWKVRFNSDWQVYGADFSNMLTPDTHVDNDSGGINIAPYASLILSQDS